MGTALREHKALIDLMGSLSALRSLSSLFPSSARAAGNSLASIAQFVFPCREKNLVQNTCAKSVSFLTPSLQSLALRRACQSGRGPPPCDCNLQDGHSKKWSGTLTLLKLVKVDVPPFSLWAGVPPSSCWAPTSTLPTPPALRSPASPCSPLPFVVVVVWGSFLLPPSSLRSGFLCAGSSIHHSSNVDRFERASAPFFPACKDRI